ncbi:acyl-CoA dehydrogenase family protein [Streptomyces rugosispiralis]|uniref:Acyl-CoA dehydrogenase n=1 Tax=Streptomyces rugosispiralis TaxID=2967341 RepID=A0ABT1V1K8_9ACTN|nr:acyl-CoA dehydrogenase [Streptomyces rugosispiralis]MCQ8191274.1 acyl-CoA dehydrogenase [Streptomyces rugosispiralis]
MTTASPTTRTQDPSTTPLDRLTRLLGELSGPGQPFSPEALAELDRTEAFPTEACRALDAFGLRRFYVPAEHGGALESFDVVMRLLRAVSRIDLTVALSHGKTYLGAAATWIAGEPEAARRLGRRIADGTPVSCALTERHHGSDLMAGEVTARPAPGGGWLLSGEKWLINLATRGGLVTVLARTDESGGPRGFSLFLVDKSRLAPERFTHLPKVPTYGIRGADISGIAFHDAPLPEEALIGRVGEGIEIIVKALHFSRTGCVAMSLGAGDHALALAAEFLAQDADGGRLALDPYVRRELGEAAAGLLLADATGLVAARSPHALAGEMSVVSAAAKAYVPTEVDDLIARLLHLLGPYGLLRPDEPHTGFAKVERDHRIIGIFDGSSLVNRSALIEQFPRIARGYAKGRWDAEGLAEATNPHAPLRPLRPGELSLVSSGGCSVLAGLPAAVGELRDLAARGHASTALTTLAGRLLDVSDRLHQDMAAIRFPPRAVPGHAFRLAERFESCFAAASALHLWLGAAARARGPIPEAALLACLVKALTDLEEPVDGADRTAFDELAEAVLSRPPTPLHSLLDHVEPTGSQQGAAS